MGRYKLVFRRSVAKDLRRLPNKDVARIVKRINELSENPRDFACEKLTEQERYRVRQGDYRIIYEIHDDVVVIEIVQVGHRREIYRKA
jgi:mRNA interferase RelE/StbE